MNAEIRHLGDPARHFWLTRSVARTIGLNLSEAMAMGHLSAGGYADLVNTCRKCPHAAACESWLAEHHGAALQAPGYCANCDVLNRLAAQAS